MIRGTEQQRIVTYLDGLQAKVNALRELQIKGGEELSALMASILDKAFKRHEGEGQCVVGAHKGVILQSQTQKELEALPTVGRSVLDRAFREICGPIHLRHKGINHGAGMGKPYLEHHGRRCPRVGCTMQIKDESTNKKEYSVMRKDILSVTMAVCMALALIFGSQGLKIRVHGTSHYENRPSVILTNDSPTHYNGSDPNPSGGGNGGG